MTIKDLELLNGLKKQVEELLDRDSTRLDALRQRTNMLIDKIFGEDSKYHTTLNLISFHPRMMIHTLGGGPVDSRPYIKAWNSGRDTYLNFINTMIEDISLSLETKSSTDRGDLTHVQPNTDKVFIVHGHNEEMKQSVARTIELLKLEPIILHEQPNRGRTIIQKFIDNSDVGFAIVLVSADDFGFSRSDDTKNASLRARQNVILELGFFLGKLGIERVIAIFEQVDNFEIPSDYDGVIFIPFDKDGRWRFDIIRELRALNYKVDANLIL